jgi:putative nucleotidyltransferase with HDIG domain
MTAIISVESVRARVLELPRIPAVVHEIASALQDDDIGLDALSKVVAFDPAMVAKVLRAANSPFYGMSGSISNIQDAVRLIGLRTVGTLLTTTAIMHSIAAPNCQGFNFQRFWEHSLATAICSQELARCNGYSQSTAFTAGLIHDIGRLALATYYPGELSAAIAYASGRDCSLVHAEHAVLGIGHPEVGGWIGRHWHFADMVIGAIERHHAPESHGGSSVHALADIVHAADGIVHALDLTHLDAEQVPLLDPSSWVRLGIDSVRFPQIFERTQSGFEALRDSLR